MVVKWVCLLDLKMVVASESSKVVWMVALKAVKMADLSVVL